MQYLLLWCLVLCERLTERQTEKQRQRSRGREAEAEKQRQRDRDRDRDRDRERAREGDLKLRYTIYTTQTEFCCIEIISFRSSHSWREIYSFDSWDFTCLLFCLLIFTTTCSNYLSKLHRCSSTTFSVIGLNPPINPVCIFMSCSPL